MPGSSERLEGEEVETSARVDHLPHGPPQRSQRDHFDSVRKIDDCTEHVCCRCNVYAPELSGYRSDDCVVGECSTESVIPKARGSDYGARWAKQSRFVVKEDAKQEMIVDQYCVQARSGSLLATAAASAP